ECRPGESPWRAVGPAGTLRSLHRVSGPDHPTGQDLRAQAAPVDQPGSHAFAGEPFEVAAGLAQADPPQADGADGELPTDQLVERDAPGGDVAAAVPGIQRHAVVALQRFDRLDLDQGDLAVRPGLLRVRPLPVKVAVPLQALPGNGAHLFDRDHLRGRVRRDMDGNDGSFEHRLRLPSPSTLWGARLRVSLAIFCSGHADPAPAGGRARGGAGPTGRFARAEDVRPRPRTGRHGSSGTSEPGPAPRAAGALAASSAGR